MCTIKEDDTMDELKIKIIYDFTHANGDVERRAYVTKDRADYIRCLNLLNKEPDTYKLVTEGVYNV